MATSVVVAELGYNLISYNKCPNGSQCDENVTETYFTGEAEDQEGNFLRERWKLISGLA